MFRPFHLNKSAQSKLFSLYALLLGWLRLTLLDDTAKCAKAASDSDNSGSYRASHNHGPNTGYLTSEPNACPFFHTESAIDSHLLLNAHLLHYRFTSLSFSPVRQKFELGIVKIEQLSYYHVLVKCNCQNAGTKRYTFLQQKIRIPNIRIFVKNL